MGITFYASQNSRFFLGLEGNRLTFYRETREVWQRTLSFKSFRVVGVGNKGRVVIRTEDGLMGISPHPRGEFEAIPVFGDGDLSHDDAFLVRVFLDQTGDLLAVEKVSRQSRLTEKIFRLLSSAPRVQKGEIVYDLYVYDLESKKKALVYRFPADRKLINAFHWAISPNFVHLVWAEARRKYHSHQTRFSIVDLSQDLIVDEFAIDGLDDRRITVHNSGIFLVDSPGEGESRELFLYLPGGGQKRITMTRHHALVHLGDGFVVMKSLDSPRYVFKNFNDQVMEEVELSAVEEMGMEYSVLFNQNSDVDFVARKDGELKIIHTGTDRFASDARRWRMMVDQKKIDEDNAQKKVETDAREKTIREKHSKAKALDLMNAVVAEREARSRSEEDLVREKEKSLAILKERMDDGLISRYDYLLARKELEDDILRLKAGSGAMGGTGIASQRKVLASELSQIDLGEEDEEMEGQQGEETAPESPAGSPAFDPTAYFAGDGDVPGLDLSAAGGGFQMEEPIAPIEESRVEDLDLYDPRRWEDEDEQAEPPPPWEEPPATAEAVLAGEEDARPSPRIVEREPVFLPDSPPAPPEERELTPQEREDFLAGVDVEEDEPEEAPTIEISRSIYFEDKDNEGIAGGTAGEMPRESLPGPAQEPPLPGGPPPSMPVTAVAVEDADAPRLQEMRRQIELEIQQAVERKKRNLEKAGNARARYQKLLEELEDSYQAGGISPENYLKVRQRYMERLKNVDVEFSG